MFCCSIWINSAHNSGMKFSAVPCTIPTFPTALLALLIPNTTANHITCNSCNMGMRDLPNMDA